MELPQKEPFLQLTNSLYEEIYRFELSGLQFRVLSSIMRHTFGYHNDSHEMSVRFIARDINSAISKAAEALEKLIEANIITVLQESTHGHRGRLLAVNKDTGTWIKKEKKGRHGKFQERENEADSGVSPTGEQSPHRGLPSPYRGNVQSPQWGYKGNKHKEKGKKEKDKDVPPSSGEKETSPKAQRYSIEFLPGETETIFYKGKCIYVTQKLKEELTENLSLKFSQEGFRAHFYNMDEYLRTNKTRSKDPESFIRNWLLRQMKSFYENENKFTGFKQEAVYV